MFLQVWSRAARQRVANTPQRKARRPRQALAARKPQLEALESRELLSVGQLDPTFGTNGIVTSSLTYNGFNNSLAVQSNGDIVVAGVSNGPTKEFTVARFLPTGALDTSFGVNGIASAQFSTGAGEADEARSVAIQTFEEPGPNNTTVPEQFIVVAGDTNSGPAGVDFGVARFDSTGKLDPTFGNGGLVRINFYGTVADPVNASLSSVAIEPNNRIVCAGTVTAPNTDPSTDLEFPNVNEFALARLNTDGTQDSDFDADGKILFDFSATISAGFVTGVNDGINAMTIAPNGNIIVAGFSGINNKLNGLNPTDPATGLPNRIFAVAELNENNGFLLSSFGTHGCQVTDFLFAAAAILTTTPGSETYANTVSVLPNGDIAAAGITDFGDGGHNFGLAVYTNTGTLDPNYNGIGILSTNFATDFTGASDGSAGENSIANAMVVEPNGELVLAGATDRDRTHTTFALDRYNADGTLDQAFGTHGQTVTQITPTSNDDITNSVLNTINGDILVSGTSNTGSGPTFTLAAYSAFQPGTLSFATAAVTVQQTAGSVTVTVDRTNGSDGTVTVNYATADGSALAGTNYTKASGTLSFTPGVASATFTIAITDVGIHTINPQFTVTLSGPTGGAGIGAVSTETITIDESVSNIITGSTPNPPNTTFLQNVYMDLLGRSIDPGAQANWLNQLAMGVSRTQIVLDIENSTEYRTDLVTALYQRYLHRMPDAAGLTLFVGQMAEGATIEEVSLEMTNSSEYYVNQGGSTVTGFLTALYRDILGRAIDPSGLATFSQALNLGLTRSQVIIDLLTSHEYLSDVVNGYYMDYLRRAADQAGLANFVAQLEIGTHSLQPIFVSNPNIPVMGPTDQDIAAVILGSTEYFDRPA
jgi:uncharacterized delta-60 repeat protein